MDVLPIVVVVVVGGVRLLLPPLLRARGYGTVIGLWVISRLV